MNNIKCIYLGMEDVENPFQLTGYHGPELFCDREEETARLISNVKNGVNSTLLSVRRMGKTGLIHHTFHFLSKQKNIRCIYADVYATQNIKEFTSVIAKSVMKTFPEKNSIGKKFMILLKSLRPVITFDPISGDPEVSFDFMHPKQQEQSLSGVFSFLDKQGIKLVIAIDEFQQINEYPEKNTEAFLRTIIQPLKNVRFIFCGSNRHMLSDIFNNSKRPFFSSTQSVSLSTIPEKKYLAFIAAQFKKHKRKIDNAALEYIAEYTRLHTFYTQAVCNRIFATGIKDVKIDLVKRECYSLLKELEINFFQIRNLLTTIQWNLLRAIAKENKVYQPHSKDFIHTYKLGTPSSIQRCLDALMNKEMIFSERDESGAYFAVYDCFLSRWLQKGF